MEDSVGEGFIKQATSRQLPIPRKRMLLVKCRTRTMEAIHDERLQSCIFTYLYRKKRSRVARSQPGK